MNIRIRTLFPFSVRIKRILKKLGRILKILFFFDAIIVKVKEIKNKAPF